MILSLIIISPFKIEAKIKDVFRISKDTNTRYIYCPNIPFSSVCMSESEYRYMYQKAMIENKILKNKINYNKRSFFDDYDLEIGIAIGLGAYFLLDKHFNDR